MFVQQPHFTAIIIDDEADARFVLDHILQDISEIEVIGLVDNGEDAILLISELQPDIAFIDIELPGKNGIEIAKEIKNISKSTKVVFTTAHKKYAIDAIKNHPFDYLLKPININDINELIFLLRNEFYDSHQKNCQRLKVSSKQEIKFIDLDQIVYLSANGNYTKIYLFDTRIITVTSQLGKLVKQLPLTDFYRINRSTIINLNYLNTIKRKNKVLVMNLKDSVIEFPISSNNIKHLEKLFS